MLTVSTFRKLLSERLQHLYPKEECFSIASILLEDLLGMDRTTQHLHPEKVFDPTEEAALLQAINRLKTGEPVQYVTGFAAFYGMMLKVNPSVLIPRPETEELVALAIDFLKKQKMETPRIVDVCTGSGCIAIALKKELPGAEVTALDISKEALDVAIENAELILGENAIQFVQSDFLQDNSWTTGQYDLIISNPPYVTMADKEKMQPNVLYHEPHLALFVPKEDPLIFYRALASFAKKHLQIGGMLCMEINESLGKSVVQLFTEAGFGKAEIKKDLNGKDRMVVVFR